MLLLTQPLPNPEIAKAEYIVIADTRYESFAGKFGRRVNETLTLQKDGQTLNVSLSHAHTQFGAVAQFAKGDHIMISGDVKNNIVILRDHIAKL